MGFSPASTSKAAVTGTLKRLQTAQRFGEGNPVWQSEGVRVDGDVLRGRSDAGDWMVSRAKPTLVTTTTPNGSKQGHRLDTNLTGAVVGEVTSRLDALATARGTAAPGQEEQALTTFLQLLLKDTQSFK